MTAGRGGSPAPDRSLVQRMEALQYGNAIRMYRAQLKRDVAAARIDADVVLVQPHDSRVAAMKVEDLMLAVPGMGKTKVDYIFRRNGISVTKTIAGLSPRQRGALLVALRSHQARSNLYQQRKALLEVAS